MKTDTFSPSVDQVNERYKLMRQKLLDCVKLLDQRYDDKTPRMKNKVTACQLACDELAIAIITKELACA